MVIYDSRAIQEILPHRYPFLLVDKIIELEPRVRIVGIKQVTINEHFFAGHFPEAAVMPGVLQIEALAQVGAILALREFPNRARKDPLFQRDRKGALSAPRRPRRYAGAGSDGAEDRDQGAENARRSESGRADHRRSRDNVRDRRPAEGILIWHKFK